MASFESYFPPNLASMYITPAVDQWTIAYSFRKSPYTYIKDKICFILGESTQGFFEWYKRLNIQQMHTFRTPPLPKVDGSSSVLSAIITLDKTNCLGAQYRLVSFWQGRQKEEQSCWQGKEVSTEFGHLFAALLYRGRIFKAAYKGERPCLRGP